MTSARRTTMSQRRRQTAPRAAAAAQSASTPVMRSGDTAVGQQQQPGQRRRREADAAELPAELYSTSLLDFRAHATHPTLTQNLREYLTGRMSDEMIQNVDEFCTVEQYLRSPARYCAHEQVRQRIDDMPGMRVVRGVYLLWRARFLSVGEWAGAEEPKRVPGMSKETCETVKQAVDTAVLRAAQRRRVEPAGEEDEYGYTCEQLLAAGVGKALYVSVRDATWRALHYVTDAAEGRVPFAADTDSETALPASIDDGGMKYASGDIHDAQEGRRKKVVLHTLYSERGWPTMWLTANRRSRADERGIPAAVVAPQAKAREALADDAASRMLLVNYEMQRAWKRVVQYYNSINTIDTLDTLPRDKQPFIPPPRQDDGVRGRVLSSIEAMSHMAAALVVGTPGIGKTMSGNYMVYRLLHDANAPRYVVFAVADYVYIFDKQRECVSCYKRAAFDTGDFCRMCGAQCVYIHDCTASTYKLDAASSFDVALLIVLSSSNTDNYDTFVSKAMSEDGIVCVVMHSWSYCELSCYARLVGIDDKTLQERVSRVGPLPRYVLRSTSAYEYRVKAVDTKIDERIDNFDSNNVGVADTLLSVGRDAANPSNTLYDMRRDDAQRAQQHDRRRNAANVNVSGNDMYTYRLLTRDMHQRLLTGVLSKMKGDKDSLVAAIARFISLSQSYEEITCAAVATRLFWRALCVNRTPGLTLRRLSRTTAAAAPLTRQCVEQWLGQGNTTIQYYDFRSHEDCYFGRNELVKVFRPRPSNFVYLDAFLLLRCNDDIHFVGVQATRDHKITHNKIEKFFKEMPPLTIELHEVEKANMRRRKYRGPTTAAAATATARQQRAKRAHAAAATRRRSNAATVNGSSASDKWVYTTPDDKLALFTRGVATRSVIYVSDTMNTTERLPLENAPTHTRVKRISDDYTTFYNDAVQYLVHVTVSKMLEAKVSIT